MIKNETRESAHLKSRVKDLSVVPNLVSFTGLFTAITPIAKLEKNPDTNCYDPILIRDTDSLIANFGDPRIDPEKYIDLYTIMQVIGNGTSCYVCKVNSGDTGIYEFAFVPEENIINNREVDTAAGDDADNGDTDSDTDTQVDDSSSTANDEPPVKKTVIDADIEALTNADGYPLIDASNKDHPNRQTATLDGDAHNKYVLSRVFGRINAGEKVAATDTGSLEGAHVQAKGDYDGKRGNDLSVQIDEVTPGTAATWASGAPEGTPSYICTAVTPGEEWNNTHIEISSETDPMTVTIEHGGNTYVANIGNHASTIQYETINNAAIVEGGVDGDTVGTYVRFAPNNDTDTYFDTPENASFSLTGGTPGTPSTYTVTVWDGDNQVYTTSAPVTSAESVECDYIDVLALDALQKIKLHGGVDATPAQEWELNPDFYSVEFDKNPVDDSNPDAETTYKVTVTVDDPKHPNKIIIKEAALDPEYGREDIELDVYDEDQWSDSEKKKYDGKKVFKSKPLDRKYTIMALADPDDADTVFGDDAYATEWQSEGDKYVLYVVFDDPSLVESVQKLSVTKAARQSMSIVAYSSMADAITISCTLSQAKPYSLKLFYLNVAISSNGNTLGTAKVKLESTTTNQSIVNNINSSLGTYARFELVDPDTKSACIVKESGKNSIVAALLDTFAPFAGNTRNNLADNPTPLPAPVVLSQPNFKVTLQDYIDAQMQYKDHRYVGCLMADFTAPVTHTLEGAEMVKDSPKSVMPLDPEERRALHYNLKQIACERKDSTVILSTPLTKGHTDPYTWFTMDEICNWVASQGDYTDLWEYGAGNTTDYSIQSFYLEIYYSWLNLQCTKIENGLAKSVKVKVAPANLVVDNVLRSWRERGIQYPVAGDQYGTLTDQCAIIQNPKTKLERDQLVQYRINPIWDTGTRGVQIYGNETLNAGYTDLNAAHIARTLVYIRSRIDEYTETLKFLINSQILWDTWKNYVSSRILAPLQATEALSSYRVTMGEETTSREEIANRIVKGNVELTFYQAAEIFDLSFIVYSSATTVEEANPL